jgi:aryl-alcohol dehydrogenase-like predicted oxidoreductase
MQKYMYFHDNDFEIATAAQKVAKEHGVTPTQIACAWILQAPGVTAPIIGATKTHHLKQIFEAVDIKLSAEEVEALEKPYRPHPIIGHAQARGAKMLN